MNIKQYVKKHGQTGAARILGVTQGYIWQVLDGRLRITAERAVEFERTTRGELTRTELRPDLWPRGRWK
jgi:DNA-binding transcriptional regulator YdaS (Cro superfamily)